MSSIDHQPTGPVLRAVVLLDRQPSGVGSVIDVLLPDAAAAIGNLPLTVMTVDVNEVPVTFEIGSGPLSAREFDYAVSQSPLRDRVQAAAARHGGYLMLTAEVGNDVFHAANLLSTITAAYAADDNGIVVWLPDADLATTDVMYVGDVDRRPAHVWFNTMAARVDAATSIAHTIGVPALGGLDVQLRTSSLDPAGAFKELRSAVAGLLEARTLPAPGLTLVIGSQPHVLTPATSQIGMGNVLDAVPSGPPVPQAAVPVEKPKRRGWFGRG